MPAPADYTQDFGQYVEDALVSLGVPPYGETPPEPEPPFVPDECVVAQIAREPSKITGKPKTAFDIILTSLNPNGPLWTAPYKVSLDNDYGWISGDRAGYTKAYMFLVDRLTGRVGLRVSFWTVKDSAGNYFTKINDQYMDEIQITKLGYDGTCGDPADQGQQPGYEPGGLPVANPPDVRPIIRIREKASGLLLDDRSYTNTVTPGASVVRFADAGYTDRPFPANNGYDNAPHTVYERQRVFALLPRGPAKSWVEGVGVDYDVLDPRFTITQE